tara:strand:+ start:7989 stop:9332 length:1344 start_codon:yes stop_codon:yes gene_type:complete
MKNLNRRDFIRKSTIISAKTILVPVILKACTSKAVPSDRLNVAFIGAGGKGLHAIQILVKNPMMNIVALADVDDRMATKTYEKLPNVKHFRDFRKMLDKMGEQIDAVVISTPDHTHHYIAKYCLLEGKHVYLEKPLAHNIREVRELMDLEKKTGLACQMGNQGHSGNGIKQLNEWIEKGFLGEINEIHAWTLAGWNDADVIRPVEQDIPDGLDWDLWLGPATEIPYNEAYLPARWRGWNAFGSGSLGDFACHNMDAPYTVLDLDCPDKVEVESTGTSNLSFPKSAKLTFSFPICKFGNSVKLSWYQGDEFLPPKPAGLGPDQKIGNNMGGTLIVGSEATVVLDSHAGNPRIIPTARHAQLQAEFAKYENPGPWNGHYDNWLKACRGEEKVSSSFYDGGRLTETMLWGNIALKTNTNITINPKTKEIVNNSEASALMGYPEPRKGWRI